MDLTQLANLGEFIGGVAVLVTLVYLAVQVRSGAREGAGVRRYIPIFGPHIFSLSCRACADLGEMTSEGG